MKIDNISVQRSPNVSTDRVEKPKIVTTTKIQESSEKNESEVNSRINKQELQKKIESVNKFLEPSQTSLKFQFHDKLHEYYVSIVDSKTNEVIREIPPKKFLDMYAFMIESIGLIVDHRI